MSKSISLTVDTSIVTDTSTTTNTLKSATTDTLMSTTTDILMSTTLDTLSSSPKPFIVSGHTPVLTPSKLKKESKLLSRTPSPPKLDPISEPKVKLDPLTIPKLELTKLPSIREKRVSLATTASSLTGREIIKFVATARTNKLYDLIGLNKSDDKNSIYQNLDDRIKLLSDHEQYKSLTSVEKTDFLHHLLTYLHTEIERFKPPRVRRDVQKPRYKTANLALCWHKEARAYYFGRKKWKRWKTSHFEKGLLLTKFMITTGVDFISLKHYLDKMDIKLEHILIYFIQNKTDSVILNKMNTIKITPKCIRSYRGKLTANWLMRAKPYIEHTLFKSLKRKAMHSYLAKKKRHCEFVKTIKSKVKRDRERRRMRADTDNLIYVESRSESDLTPKAVTRVVKAACSFATYKGSSPVFDGCTVYAGIPTIPTIPT